MGAFLCIYLLAWATGFALCVAEAVVIAFWQDRAFTKHLKAGRAVALANEKVDLEPDGEGYRVALGNSAEIDDEGWALIAPFGEHPKTRVYRDNGKLKEQEFIQVLDNDAADSMVGKENSFFGKLKRALVGIPVYKLHGDLNDIDPRAVSNAGQKVKLGVIDQVRKSARGIEAHFALDNDGAEAVKAGYKYPSAFWFIVPFGKRALANGIEATLCKPFKLISVALTPYPNISGVESLANARPTEPAARETTKNTNDKMKELLIGWLAAKGIVLANDTSDNQVLKAVQDHCATQSNAVSALGNEKTTLSGQVTSLTSERDREKQRADQNATALSNEQTARKSDRKAAAEVVADTAVKLGIVTVAERDSQVSALENSADFTKDAKALLAKAPTHTTTQNGRDVSGKTVAALDNEAVETQSQYQQAFQKELIAAGQDPVKAHRAIMTKPEYAGLAERLTPRK